MNPWKDKPRSVSNKIFATMAICLLIGLVLFTTAQILGGVFGADALLPYMILMAIARGIGFFGLGGCAAIIWGESILRKHAPPPHKSPEEAT